jgi:hypothetical protein
MPHMIAAWCLRAPPCEPRIAAAVPTGADPRRTWALSLVGDWTSTTIDGVAQPRTHTSVHEATRLGASTNLSYDIKGNLTVDERGQRFVWDIENRLRDLDDQLGRRN